LIRAQARDSIVVLKPSRARACATRVEKSRLWDPLRDFTVHPVTEADLERVLGVAEQIVSDARSALVAFKQAGQDVQIGKLPTDVEMNDRLGEAEHEVKRLLEKRRLALKGGDAWI
jgi:hypothetical protein